MLQKDIATIIGITEDCVTNWENNRNIPQIQFMPKIIKFLGYNPNQCESITLGQKIKKFRVVNGLSLKKFGKLFNVDDSTVLGWEINKIKPRSNIKIKLEKLLEE